MKPGDLLFTCGEGWISDSIELISGSASRARSRLGGRPKKLDLSQVKMDKSLYDSRQYSVREICDMMGISKQTLFNYLHQTKQARDGITISHPCISKGCYRMVTEISIGGDEKFVGIVNTFQKNAARHGYCNQ